MNLIMFDIDGTLTRACDAEDSLFLQTMADLFGFRDVSTDWGSYRHCSDSGIINEVFEQRLGRLPRVDEVRQFQTRFALQLKAELISSPVQAVVGASEMLEQLARTPNMVISLATGGWESCARLKLSSAGLPLLGVPAAFADDAQARSEIMQISLARAARSHDCKTFDTVIYVGDGVWDGRAASALGWRFIGIAQDSVKGTKLRAEGALEVLDGYVGRDLVGLLSTLCESPSDST